MGHIVFATPSIARFHLHERLRRELLRRGHRVRVLCTERCSFTFWREQLAGVDCLSPDRLGQTELPQDERLQRALVGDREARLRQLWPAAQRWFEHERADLVLLHVERDASAILLQLAARGAGSRVLWSGDGLLPHTLQVDDHGLDGEASCRRWSASDYRVVEPEPELLDASLAHALAGTEPMALPRAEVQVPPLGRRLADAMACLGTGSMQGALTAVQGWRDAFLRPTTTLSAPLPSLDLRPPFVAVLLQHQRDQRLRLDADAAPGPRALVQQAMHAAAAMAAATNVVVVLPTGVMPSPAIVRSLGLTGRRDLQVLAANHAAVVAAAAATTVTVNHPLASVALLASTPVVLLGRALYELPGVTTKSTLHDLPAAVVGAQRADRGALRRRFLTWLFRHGHVWCSPTHPNHNGMLGLVQTIERRLTTAADQDRPLPYRAGPTWPLAAP